MQLSTSCREGGRNARKERGVPNFEKSVSTSIRSFLTARSLSSGRQGEMRSQKREAEAKSWEPDDAVAEICQ